MSLPNPKVTRHVITAQWAFPGRGNWLISPVDLARPLCIASLLLGLFNCLLTGQTFIAASLGSAALH